MAMRLRISSPRQRACEDEDVRHGREWLKTIGRRTLQSPSPLRRHYPKKSARRVTFRQDDIWSPEGTFLSVSTGKSVSKSSSSAGYNAKGRKHRPMTPILISEEDQSSPELPSSPSPPPLPEKSTRKGASRQKKATPKPSSQAQSQSQQPLVSTPKKGGTTLSSTVQARVKELKYKASGIAKDRQIMRELDRFAAGKPLANFIRRLPGLGLGSVTMMVMYI
ncbi:hypothetical protein PCH_Pc20g11640 [Penicillium rubens Wisconsin 54-1255]|uniref:Uncharacterized protein n=1 Tax=Penicillium rubens (strain ATCC 28089 / DSM 1075 / NRRL 1951 / Wisconsin 54-1255) TaxID=500485 RepID=B6HG98_PENRW|nr:hypothetical protein PCH_Pc20g11640 [Penicillium rubens Wisconsin 54-1255]